MPNYQHVNFVLQNKKLLKEPVLLIGARVYDYDPCNFTVILKENGIKELVGIDLSKGDFVDFQVDITDSENAFFKNHEGYFNSIIFMEVLYTIPNPFVAAENVSRLCAPGGTLFYSDAFVRKIAKMPTDYWRFTYDAHKLMFSQFEFDDSKVKMSLTREKQGELLPYDPDPVILDSKSPDESSPGYFLRRLHRKFFAKGFFKVSRLYPEITIFSVARRK